MSRIVASAPGKAMICGEYAVLRGAPAIVVALDRRAVVSVAPSAGSRSTLVTAGYLDGERAWDLVDGTLAWADPATTGLGLFEAVMAASPAPAGTVTVTIDTRAFRDAATGRKLGLGSSAATAVALAAALDPAASAAATCRVAMGAHRAFQEGRGSGFDIAAAHHGGVIRYTKDAEPVRLEWPDGLHARYFWTGQAASTSEHIRRLDSLGGKSETDALGKAAQAVAARWAGGDAADVLEALRAYTGCLREFDRLSGLGIFAGGQGRLANRAAGHDDIVYKPCGAGGGDIGVALAQSHDSLEAFADDARGAGILALDVAPDAEGLLIEGRTT